MFVENIILHLFAFFGAIAGEKCRNLFTQNPKDCSTYFQCDNGVNILRNCPVGLEWHATMNICDWPEQAGCANKIKTNEVETSKETQRELEVATPINPVQDSGSHSSDNGLVSQSEFDCAAQTKEGHPDASFYQGFIQSLPEARISDKTEAAKFLAHEVWETVGFQFTREQYCIQNMAACETAYPNTQGKKGQVYYGRGMLQLTWDYNYAAASQALYHSDTLIQNPDLVADDPIIGCATAAWFWRTNVHSVAATFGGTLKAINGALECDGGPHAQNRILRFQHYKKVLNCLKISPPPESDGYCHA